MIEFCYDDLGDYNIGYPNLARRDIEPWQFDDTWPRTVPLRLLLYLVNQNIPHSARLVSDAPAGAWYPIAWAWHDFNCDYVGLLSNLTKQRLQSGEIRLLCYYHEGDNPQSIVDHMRSRCLQHDISPESFLLVSANSSADHIDQACYFPDHEYFFRWLNRSQSPNIPQSKTLAYRFTALNRLHKSWRGMIMADLVDQGILADDSLWSYNTEIVMDDADAEHPLASDSITRWPEITARFLARGPYTCDDMTADAHNDHTQVNADLYTKSACHIVFETLLDADNSDGTFLTEKTYKCIKFGQPFVIIGPHGSLERLRQDGYRTFDHVIDPSYDRIKNSTDRYLRIRKTLETIKQKDPQEFYNDCLQDLIHNQRTFLDLQSKGLQNLIRRLS